jgi:hypothetical protein
MLILFESKANKIESRFFSKLLTTTIAMYEYTKNEAGHFVCPICSKTKRLQSTMHYHMKTHEGPFFCPHCTKEYKSESNLRDHILDSHPTQNQQKRELFVCPCPGCGHESKTKGNRIPHFLRNHCGNVIEAYELFDNQSHTSTCSLCEIEFKNRASYIYHLAQCLIHHNIVPHELLRSVV